MYPGLRDRENPTMRYVNRSQGINTALLHELLRPGNKHGIELRYADTTLMVADIHTKPFTAADKWRHATFIANVIPFGQLGERVKHQSLYFRLFQEPFYQN